MILSVEMYLTIQGHWRRYQRQCLERSKTQCLVSLHLFRRSSRQVDTVGAKVLELHGPSKQEEVGTWAFDSGVPRKTPCASRTRKRGALGDSLQQKTVSGGGKRDEEGGVEEVFCFVAVSDDGPIVDAQKYAAVAFQLYISAPSFPTTSSNVECITASHNNDVALRQKCRNRFKAWLWSRLLQSSTPPSDESWLVMSALSTTGTRHRTISGFSALEVGPHVERDEKYCICSTPENDCADVLHHSRWRFISRRMCVRCAPQ